MYVSPEVGMKHGVLALLVLPLILSIGACARPLATGPLAIGVAAASDGRWDEAVQYWKQVLAQDPASAAAHNNLAVACERQGAWEEARREYEAALRLEPDNAAIRDNFESFKLRLDSARRRRP